MMAKSLKKMFKMFDETGSFEVKSGKGRRAVPSILVKNVTTALMEETTSGVQTCSARRIVRSLDLYVNTVFKKLCNILYCYL